MVQGLSAWQIIGMFLGAVLVVTLIIFVIALLVRKVRGSK